MRIIFFLILLFSSVCLAEPQPLPAEQAFQLSTQIDAQHHKVKLHWQIAKNYYLYKDRIQIKSNDRNIKIDFPVSEKFKNYQIYRDQLTLEVPYLKDQTLVVNYQGCSDAGFCYPPMTENLLNTQNSIDTLIEKLKYQKTIFILATFFILGLLTSLTPCVLPMIPILLNIIIGQEISTRKQAFFSASLYVLSISVVYALIGIGASALGINLNISLQSPIFLGSTAVILILLALALFDWYHLNLPNQWLQKLTHRIPKNNYLGIILLGIISSLILSPCVTPPLVAAILFMTQTHNLFLGGSSLFFMSLGIGTPLILVATFGQQFLPKSGKWMIRIKQFIAWLLIITAIFLLLRFIPIMHLFSSNQFKTVYQLAEIQYQLSQADLRQKPIILDIYADWCISCVIMEQTTFKDKTVQKLLKNYDVIRVDITKNDDNAKAILKHFNIIAPPTLLFFNAQGKEIPNSRMIGEIKAPELIEQIGRDDWI